MQWLAENWFLVLLGGGMVAMHLFGHGHGGHGGSKGGGHDCCGPKKSAGDTNADSAAVSTDEPSANDPARPKEHRHG